MCATIALPDGRWLHSPRELAAAGLPLSDAALVELADELDGMPVEPLDVCLCLVDVPALLGGHGVGWSDDDGLYMVRQVPL
ncbi:hypothetical protein [Desertimonas flava]|uniref:hypothetical protein n=1 Tax=Desertimonas flava TaxID=2064846 RepID=UPI000E3494D2|nr:hypothetical protein [Desertimonas flava]